MARKRDTGAGEPYSDAEAERVAMAIEAAYADWDSSQEPSRIDVRARVEWAGVGFDARVSASARESDRTPITRSSRGT